MALRHLQKVREHGTNAVHGLVRAVDGQHVAIGVIVGNAGVRLHRGVMQARQLHRAAHLNEPFGALLLFADLQRVFVSDGCFALQTVLARERIIKADGKRELFILYFDKTRGSLRCFLVAGRNCADLIADKTHVVVEDPFFICHIHVKVCSVMAVFPVGGVQAVINAVNARKRQRLFRVDCLDIAMRDLAVEHAEIRHIGQREIAGVFGIPRGLALGVVDRTRCSNVIQMDAS